MKKEDRKDERERRGISWKDEETKRPDRKYVSIFPLTMGLQCVSALLAYASFASRYDQEVLVRSSPPGGPSPQYVPSPAPPEISPTHQFVGLTISFSRCPLDRPQAIFFMYAANSKSAADAGNLVVISFFSGAPFPRLSVIVGAILTFVWQPLGRSPNWSFKATRAAKASSVAMTSAGSRKPKAIHLHVSPARTMARPSGPAESWVPPIRSRSSCHWPARPPSRLCPLLLVLPRNGSASCVILALTDI